MDYTGLNVLPRVPPCAHGHPQHAARCVQNGTTTSIITTGVGPDVPAVNGRWPRFGDPASATAYVGKQTNRDAFIGNAYLSAREPGVRWSGQSGPGTARRRIAIQRGDGQGVGTGARVRARWKSGGLTTASTARALKVHSLPLPGTYTWTRRRRQHLDESGELVVRRGADLDEFWSSSISSSQSNLSTHLTTSFTVPDPD